MILLARHGETDYNRTPVRIMGQLDVPLNATGREQAAAMAARLAEATVSPAGIVSSHLSRARETAELIAARLGLELQVDARLAETDRGEWQGRTWEEVAAADPRGYAAWRKASAGFRFPGGESLEEQMTRVLNALGELEDTGEAPRLVVCHGGSIRVALCHARKRGLAAFHEWDVPNGALIRL